MGLFSSIVIWRACCACALHEAYFLHGIDLRSQFSNSLAIHEYPSEFDIIIRFPTGT